MKTQYPLTLEQLLRRWMPKERHPDRERIYRQYLKETLHFDGWNPPKPATDNEVVELVKKKRSGWFTERRVEDMSSIFDAWYCGYKLRIRRERSAKANSARWKMSLDHNTKAPAETQGAEKLQQGKKRLQQGSKRKR